MNLFARPVTPRAMQKSPKVSSKEIRACIRSTPGAKVSQYAISSGIAGVTHPGTTGSPNVTWAR